MNYDNIKNWYNAKHEKQGNKSWRPAHCYDYFLDRIGAISGFNKHVSLLDVGCGIGYLLKAADERGFETFGIDISEKGVELAKKNSPNSKIKVSNMNFEIDDVNKYNYITCVGALEHTLNIEESLIKIRDCGSTYAWYLIVVPNINFLPWKFLKPGTDQQEINEKLNDLSSWNKLFVSSGFDVINIQKDLSLSLKYKGIKKFIMGLFLSIIPLEYTYQFCFVLRMNKSFKKIP